MQRMEQKALLAKRPSKDCKALRLFNRKTFVSNFGQKKARRVFDRRAEFFETGWVGLLGHVWKLRYDGSDI